MNKRTTKKILYWGDGSMTMNTNGELIFTMEVKTIYYFYKVPIWKKTEYIDGTKEQLSTWAVC